MGRTVEWYKKQVASRAGDSGYDTEYYRSFLLDDILRSVRRVESRIRRGATSRPFFRGTQTISTSVDGTSGDYALNADFAAPIELKWNGVSRIALATTSAAVTAGSGASITVTTVEPFTVGSRYIIKSGDTEESFTVSAIGATTITASVLSNDYASGSSILELSGVYSTNTIDLVTIDAFEQIRATDSTRWVATVYHSSGSYRIMFAPAPFTEDHTFILYYDKRQGRVRDDLEQITIFPDDDWECEDLVIQDALSRAFHYYGKTDQAMVAEREYERLMEDKLRVMCNDAPNSQEYPSIHPYDKYYKDREGWI